MDIHTKEFWLLKDIATVWSQEPGKLSKEEIEHKFWESYWLDGFLDEKSGKQLLKIYLTDKVKAPEFLDFDTRQEILEWLHASGALCNKDLGNTHGEEAFQKISKMNLSFSNLKMNESHELFVNKGFFKSLGIKTDNLIDWCQRNGTKPPKVLINPALKAKKGGRPKMSEYQTIQPLVFEAFNMLHQKNTDNFNNKTVAEIQEQVRVYLTTKKLFVNVSLPKTTTFSQWMDEWCKKNAFKRKKGQGKKKRIT